MDFRQGPRRLPTRVTRRSSQNNFLDFFGPIVSRIVWQGILAQMGRSIVSRIVWHGDLAKTGCHSHLRLSLVPCGTLIQPKWHGLETSPFVSHSVWHDNLANMGRSRTTPIVSRIVQHDDLAENRKFFKSIFRVPP